MKVINNFLLFLFLSFGVLPQNRNIPTYKEGKEILAKLIETKLNIPKEDIQLVEQKKNRIIRKWEKNQFIFYYRYKMIIPIYRRKEKSIQLVSTREEEIWLRIPESLSNLQFSFLRIDLLPGTHLTILE